MEGINFKPSRECLRITFLLFGTDIISKARWQLQSPDREILREGAAIWKAVGISFESDYDQVHYSKTSILQCMASKAEAIS